MKTHLQSLCVVRPFSPVLLCVILLHKSSLVSLVGYNQFKRHEKHSRPMFTREHEQSLSSFLFQFPL